MFTSAETHKTSQITLHPVPAVSRVLVNTGWPCINYWWAQHPKHFKSTRCDLVGNTDQTVLAKVAGQAQNQV